MNIEKELLDLKNQLRKKQQEKDRLEGKKAALFDRLQKEFGCSSLSAGKKLLIKLEKEHAAGQLELETGLNNLKQAFAFEDGD